MYRVAESGRPRWTAVFAKGQLETEKVNRKGEQGSEGKGREGGSKQLRIAAHNCQRQARDTTLEISRERYVKVLCRMIRKKKKSTLLRSATALRRSGSSLMGWVLQLMYLINAETQQFIFAILTANCKTTEFCPLVAGPRSLPHQN